MVNIEDLIETIKQDYDIGATTIIPLHGGMSQYIIRVMTRPNYSRGQLRLFSIEDMNNMLEDNFSCISVSSYVDRKGDVHYYKKEEGEL